MKKTISLILALALIILAFAGCAAQPKEEDVTIRVGGLKGPTSMGIRTRRARCSCWPSTPWA